MQDIPYDTCADCGKLFPDAYSGERNALIFAEDGDEICEDCEDKRMEKHKGKKK